VLIPVVTIPLSLVRRGIIMAALGFSLNLLTLLAYGAGNRARRRRRDRRPRERLSAHRRGPHPAQAALIGAREIAGPVISMTLDVAAVYAPIGFLGASPVLCSRIRIHPGRARVIIPAWSRVTLSPMMCSLVLSREMLHGRFVHLIDRAFSRLAEWYAAN